MFYVSIFQNFVTFLQTIGGMVKCCKTRVINQWPKFNKHLSESNIAPNISPLSNSSALAFRITISIDSFLLHSSTGLKNYSGIRNQNNSISQLNPSLLSTLLCPSLKTPTFQFPRLRRTPGRFPKLGCQKWKGRYGGSGEDRRAWSPYRQSWELTPVSWSSFLVHHRPTEYKNSEGVTKHMVQTFKFTHKENCIILAQSGDRIRKPILPKNRKWIFQPLEATQTPHYAISQRGKLTPEEVKISKVMMYYIILI